MHCGDGRMMMPFKKKENQNKMELLIIMIIIQLFSIIIHIIGAHIRFFGVRLQTFE